MIMDSQAGRLINTRGERGTTEESDVKEKVITAVA
jgi:hypothetical protein